VEDNFVAAAVEQVGPAVVRINASQVVRSEPDFLDRFFGRRISPSQRLRQGTGSGFIISPEGLILTNAHVVDDADEVTVTLKDGRTIQGEVLGQDEVTDVAVVAVATGNLPTVVLGDSDQIYPGEWAIAIGNPLGLDNTVTLGIISATGRSSGEVGVPDKRVSFIQTDAAINPGNSGGPLLSAQGTVIGMNTAIIGKAQGLGFAIPINTAQRIAEQLIARGRVDHPYLGIRMVTLTPDVRQEINAGLGRSSQVTLDQGVLILEVVANSPAAQAGLRAGDVLLKLDSQTVTDSSTVQVIIQESEVGDPLKLELQRGELVMHLTVRPGLFPTALLG